MQATQILSQPADVDRRLAAFSVDRIEFTPLIEAVVAARANVIPGADAAAAAGQQAYLAGVRHLRFIFLPKGWKADRADNIEAVVHPETGTRIVFQSVDDACSARRGPRAINGKGAAVDRLLEGGQGCLFDDADLPEAVPPDAADLNGSVWFLCVSIEDEKVRAELSLPASIEAQNFGSFLERIFIVGDGDWPAATSVVSPPEAPDDYSFTISRK